MNKRIINTVILLLYMFLSLSMEAQNRTVITDPPKSIDLNTLPKDFYYEYELIYKNSNAGSIEFLFKVASPTNIYIRIDKNGYLGGGSIDTDSGTRATFIRDGKDPYYNGALTEPNYFECEYTCYSNSSYKYMVYGISLGQTAKITIQGGKYIEKEEGTKNNTNSILTLNPREGMSSINYSNGAVANYLGKSNMQMNIQYFDGLGRPNQIIQIESTPNRGDLVSYQEYDGLDRVSDSWLPVIKTDNKGIFVPFTTFKIASTATYNNTIYNSVVDTNPYSKPIYETSPLNRILKQYGPGTSWHTGSKAVRTGYLTNKTKSTTTLTIADSLVCGMILCTAPLTYNYTRNYEVGELYVTRLKDEDDNISYEFRNKLGQVVLARQLSGVQMLDTYFVYDDYGNLSIVLPPMASDKIYQDKAQLNSGSGVRTQFAYMYKYDARNRCIWKKLPGADWVYYVYDKANQLVFSQDGEQRTKKTGNKSEWTFNKYDALGRLVISGVYRTAETQSTLSTKYESIVVKEEIIKGESYGYTWNTLSDINLTNDVLHINYYDDYEVMLQTNAYFKSNLDYNEETGYEVRHSSAKGLLVGTRIKSIDAQGKSTNDLNAQIATAIYYNNRGQIVQTKSNNHLGGLEKEYISYNFTGQPIKKKHIHTVPGKASQTETYDYTYDHANRLLTTHHTWNTGAKTLIASNNYDELGRLKTKQKGNNANLRSTYAYNIRSWVTQIKSPYFTQNLYYNDKTGLAHTYSDFKASYTGNVTAMDWQIQSEARRSYRFHYDELSRIVDAAYNGVTSGGSYSASYSYDKHGNIKTMNRNGLKATNSFGQIDALVMSHIGNQLNNTHNAGSKSNLAGSAHFEDYSVDANNTKKEYTYNANGAMIQDLNKGISTIQYNSLNLPQLMDIKHKKAEARNEYIYSASGQKLRVKTSWNPYYSQSPILGSAVNATALTKSKTTDYVSNKIYENNELKRILIDGGYIEGGTYHYYLNDHLGNNRVVANAGGMVIQKNHYYPFGMVFTESTGGEKQPYKYNGKELDTEHGLNTYDYAARYMDPSIGRFTSIDPLAEKYYSISPYVYAGNNPINAIDINGDSITVLNMNDGEHVALLIQNDKGQWKYYSVNGDNVYVSGTHTGGRKFDDLGMGEFDSPQQFLESAYNSKGDKGDKSINDYEFGEGYIIPTTGEQDNTIRDTFVKNSKTEKYRLNPADPNQCATVVQRSLESAGLDVKSTETVVGRTVTNRSTGGDSYSYPTRTIRGYSYMPSTVFRDIMKNNSGTYIRKVK